SSPSRDNDHDRRVDKIGNPNSPLPHPIGWQEGEADDVEEKLDASDDEHSGLAGEEEVEPSSPSVVHPLQPKWVAVDGTLKEMHQMGSSSFFGNEGMAKTL